MHLNNLDTKKYKRFFAFGCSFTRYCWPTWADIIAQDIPYYENWAIAGAGNHYIFNSVIEAHIKYQFNEDDLVLIMWSSKDREDRYIDGKWIVATPNMQGEIYGKAWAEKFTTDSRSFLIRDLALIKSTQAFLDSTACDWANLSMIHLPDPDKDLIRKTTNPNWLDLPAWISPWNQVCLDLHDGKVSDKFENLDVVNFYKDVFVKIKYPIFSLVLDTEQHQPRPNNGDPHPTPSESLKYLDLIFPNNTISEQARFYADHWAQQVWQSSSVQGAIFESTSEKIIRL